MRQAGKVGKYLTQRFGPIARLGLQLAALVAHAADDDTARLGGQLENRGQIQR